MSKLENVVNKVQGNIVSVERKAKKFRDDFTQMDKGVSFLNSEVQELKSKEKGHVKKIKCLEDQIV